MIELEGQTSPASGASPRADPPARLKRSNTSLAHVLNDDNLNYQVEHAGEHQDVSRICGAKSMFFLNFFISLVILGEELFGLFLFDDSIASERDFFWVIFAYTVSQNFLECCGMFSKIFERCIFVALEGTQCGLFIYFAGGFESDASTFPLIVFGGFFGAQVLLALFGCCMDNQGESHEETDDQNSVKIATYVQKCYTGVFTALTSISLVYYDEKSPFRQRWFEVLIIVNFWLSTLNLMMAASASNAVVDPTTIMLAVQECRDRFGINVEDDKEFQSLPPEKQLEIQVFLMQRLQKKSGITIQQWITKFTYVAGLGNLIVTLVAQIIYFPKADQEYDIVMMWISFVSYGLICCCGCCVLVAKCAGVDLEQ